MFLTVVQPQFKKLTLAVAFTLSALGSDIQAAGRANWTIQAEIKGQRVEGMPLSWSNSEVSLLARDGYLWQFPPAEARNFRKTSTSFRSFSAGELRSSLEAELGKNLEITGTGHYLVAHPRGKGAAWAGRFEELYRSFVHYFAVRGLTIKAPQFPLVAIVWSRQEDFLRYAAKEGHRPSTSMLGYYSPITNRIVLFDSTATQGDWRQNASTIIHEATHQTAFNTGVHSRFALPPRWIAEGLGMLYESPGVYDSRNHPDQAQRVNRDRLEQFRQLVRAGRPAGNFLNLIGSDRLFETNTDVAYAESWAFAFYLAETQPRKYIELLRKTATRADFEPYSQAQRTADFTAIFGKDPRMMDAQFLRFIAELR